MLKVSHNMEGAIRRLHRLQGSIHPQIILVRALQKATSEIRRSYSLRWRQQLPGYGNSIGNATPSEWSQLKGRAGFSPNLGFFTGTTFDSIVYENISGAGTTVASQAKGNVGVAGKWPKPPYKKSSEAVSMPFDSNKDSSILDSIESSGQFGADTGMSIMSTGLQPDEYIDVSSFGAEVKYAGARAYTIPSGLMSNIVYGPKKKGGVQFIYLDPHQENSVFDSVVNMITAKMDIR